VVLSNYLPAATAQVYLYGGANLQAIVRQPDEGILKLGWLDLMVPLAL